MATIEKIVVHDAHADTRTWRERLRDAAGAVRSSWSGPLTAKSPEIARLFGSSPVSSGVAVNEVTALAIPAVHCAVTTIAADVAAMPLVLLRRLPSGGKERHITSNVYRLLHDAPNPETTSFSFRQALMENVLVTGNAYAEVARNATGAPTALWFLDPHRVTPVVAGGALRYRVAQPDGQTLTFEPRDILHLKGPSADGVVGASIVHTLKESLGLTIAADRFAATYFGNATVMGGSITVPTALPEPGRKNLRESLESRHQGVDRAHRLLLLENGATYTPFTANMQQSQLTELRTHQVREVARIFRMPPSMLGDLADATFSNVEQMTLSYYTSCLRPWLEMIEQEMTAKLLAPHERFQLVIEHVTEGLLRGDAASRAAFYASALAHGWMTVNEVRERENLPPVAGGDQPRVPSNTKHL